MDVTILQPQHEVNTLTMMAPSLKVTSMCSTNELDNILWDFQEEKYTQSYRDNSFSQ